MKLVTAYEATIPEGVYTFIHYSASSGTAKLEVRDPDDANSTFVTEPTVGTLSASAVKTVTFGGTVRIKVTLTGDSLFYMLNK